MKYKILIFADFPSPYRVEVFKGLSKHYDILVVFDKMSDQNRNAAWFCVNTGLNSISLLNEKDRHIFYQELKEIKKYDLVIAYDYHIKNAMILEFTCIIKNVPYIMNCDGAFIRKNPIKNLIKKILIKNATAFFAGSQNAIEYFKYFGAPTNKIYRHYFTSLHETDILTEPILEAESDKEKDLLKLPKKKMILSIGQFIYRKGFDVLLNAWDDYLDSNYTLVIIGGGEENINYNSYITKKEFKNIYIIDYKSKEELKHYYKASNLFVLPTREDVWGLVINEAMAFGLPIVSTNMCLGALELIENDENGFIVPCDDSLALKEAMIKALSLNKTKVGNINLNIIKHYTYENVICSHVNTINKLLYEGTKNA